MWFVIWEYGVCDWMFFEVGNYGDFDIVFECISLILGCGWDFDIVFFCDDRGWYYVYVRVSFFYDVCNNIVF